MHGAPRGEDLEIFLLRLIRKDRVGAGSIAKT